MLSYHMTVEQIYQMLKYFLEGNTFKKIILFPYDLYKFLLGNAK